MVNFYLLATKFCLLILTSPKFINARILGQLWILISNIPGTRNQFCATHVSSPRVPEPVASRWTPVLCGLREGLWSCEPRETVENDGKHKLLRTYYNRSHPVIICVTTVKNSSMWGYKLMVLSKKGQGGRRGVVVTRLIRSAKLLYAGPG